MAFDRLWHQSLGRPYRLARPIDQGDGHLVVLLHGIGRTGQVWQHVVSLLKTQGYRVVAFDLLGFGASPKPVWPVYDVDDHARAVIAGIESLKPSERVIVVGHSMGCLVAVRIARLRPDLVRHLVLYEMPLYEGLPQKRRYRLRLSLYSRLYKRLIEYQPDFSQQNARLVQKIGQKIAGFEVSAQTWLPFVRSLQNTIMRQTTADDIKQLAIPMDVIYGSLDMLVIRGKPREFFGTEETITAHTIRARHVISAKASRFIVQRILAAEQFSCRLDIRGNQYVSSS